MIRKAKPQDLDAIVNLAVESVTTIDPIPQLKIDRVAMRETASLCLEPAHFAWVSEINGEVVGAVVAQVCPGFWFEKLQLSVLLHYSQVPGEWVKLMRELSRWMKGRSGIKLAILELEPSRAANERMIRFVGKLGFDRQTLNLQYVRQAT